MRPTKSTDFSSKTEIFTTKPTDTNAKKQTVASQVKSVNHNIDVISNEKSKQGSPKITNSGLHNGTKKVVNSSERLNTPNGSLPDLYNSDNTSLPGGSLPDLSTATPQPASFQEDDYSTLDEVRANFKYEDNNYEYFKDTGATIRDLQSRIDANSANARNQAVSLHDVTNDVDDNTIYSNEGQANIKYVYQNYHKLINFI